ARHLRHTPDVRYRTDCSSTRGSEVLTGSAGETQGRRRLRWGSEARTPPGDTGAWPRVRGPRSDPQGQGRNEFRLTKPSPPGVVLLRSQLRGSEESTRAG